MTAWPPFGKRANAESVGKHSFTQLSDRVHSSAILNICLLSEGFMLSYDLCSDSQTLGTTSPVTARPPFGKRAAAEGAELSQNITYTCMSRAYLSTRAEEATYIWRDMGFSNRLGWGQPSGARVCMQYRSVMSKM